MLPYIFAADRWLDRRAAARRVKEYEQWYEAEQRRSAPQRERRRQERAAHATEVLTDLRNRVGDLTVTVFGSTVSKINGRFAAPHHYLGHPPQDIDLMIEVDGTVFARWAEAVYGVDPIGEDDIVVHTRWDGGTITLPSGRVIEVPPYSAANPTRDARRAAAEDELGVSFGLLPVDVFLFPRAFVLGTFPIPAWDREDRSFRQEVLTKGVPLVNLQPSDYS